jgi:transposase-like protein
MGKKSKTPTPVIRLTGKRVCPHCGRRKYKTMRFEGYTNVYLCQLCGKEFRREVCYA